MVGGNGGNQFRQYARQNVGNPNGYNDVQNVGNQNPNRNGNVVVARAEGNEIGNNEFDMMAAATDLDEIEEFNVNCFLKANLQQASTSGTQTDKAPVYDLEGSVEVHHYENCYNNDIFNMFTQEEQYTELLEPIPEPHQVQQNDRNVISKVSSVEQGGGTVDQHPTTIEETRAYFESLYNNLAITVEKVSEQEDTTKGTSTNTKFANQSTQRKPSLQPLRNYFVVRQPNVFQSKRTKFSKTRVPQKVDEMNDLSNSVTSNSLPTPQESKVVKKDNVIAPEMFRSNPSKTSREDKFVPINKVKASVSTNPITVSQPHVITKKGVNSNLNGLSSTGVDNTAKTRRPQPRSNTKNDRVPSKSKSSCIKNKKVEVEEHPRNLLLSKNKKHMSSECYNVKLAIQNDKSEVVCAMCKQCLITANHDVCVLNYVNGMNSRDKKQKANVSKIANQKKHKPQVKKPKKVGSKERLASPKPSKPRICLRWSPTGRIFDLCGKIIESSDYKCKSDTSVCDDENASNP
ncbi:hypothetical protein Tco_1012617 [Tanacetum coccineum]